MNASSFELRKAKLRPVDLDFSSRNLYITGSKSRFKNQMSHLQIRLNHEIEYFTITQGNMIFL